MSKSPVEWEITEDFKSYLVRVDVNESNGRAVVRVNDRIVAPPFQGGFEEREFPIGRTRYRVTRTSDDEYFLDLVVESRAPRDQRPDVSAISTRWAGLVMKGFFAAIIFVFVASGWQMYDAYFTTWWEYEPSSGACVVRMPAQPAESKRNGMTVAEVSQADCFYLAATLPIHREGRVVDDREVLDQIVRQWKKKGADVIVDAPLERRDIVAGRRVEMNYQGEIDGETVDSTMKIMVMTTRDSLIMLIAEYPRTGLAPRMKVDRFFRSLRPGW